MGPEPRGSCRIFTVAPRDALSEELAALLRDAWADAEQALVAVDRSGRILYTNAAFESLVGYESESLRGCEPPYPFWDPDHAARASSQLASMLSGQWEALGLRSLETHLRRSDGRPVRVVLAGGSLRLRGEIVGVGGFAIELAETGQREFAGVVAVASALRGLEESLCAGGGDVPALRRPDPVGSTPRERQVLGLLLEGLRVASIARRLGVSPHTVRNHLRALFRKAGVRSQAELIERYHPELPDARTDTCP